MKEDIELFRHLLADATAAITQDYFLLPVADAEGGEPLLQYRERVYAYELYHQLRLIWPEGWPYTLAGEIDKRGHPIIRRGYLDNAKPDLLVHVPGRMDRNLTVIEIKPLRSDIHPGEQEAFQRDLQKLIAFRQIGYASAHFLVFGESAERVREYTRALRDAGNEIDTVLLYHHRRAGEPASNVEW
jgi:hypothetical protein